MIKWLAVIVSIFSLFCLALLARNQTSPSQTVPVDYLPEPTSILPSGLPDSHLLKAPFIPQSPQKNWDEPWQDACEEASIITLYYYYLGQSPTTDQILSEYSKLFQYEASQSMSSDINLAQMAQVASEIYHLRPQIIDNPTVDDIKKYLVQDVPVIIPANGKILFQENKHFNSGGPWYHNLVILGYDDHVQKFIVHDVGTQFGAYYRYSYQTLLNSIHDFPSSNIKEDINLGKRKVLVLLK